MRFLTALFSLLIVPAAHTVEVPEGIIDPETAIIHPNYRDPVFFWRITSIPRDPFEPDPYFYWPDGVIKGSDGPFMDHAKPGETTLPPDVLGAMADWAASRDSTALIVVHRGRVQLERYWNDMTADTLANGRAITRSVTPLVLGFAVTDGDVSLDAPIGNYITEWSDDRRGRVTVRQLAQNASGLEVEPPKSMTDLVGNKDLCLVYCGDVVRAALAYDYARKPDTRFEVAQENTQLLALVIERAMGRPMEEILSDRVWKKIGAKDATFQLDRPGGTARVMCCMRATPRDWVRLGMLIAADGIWQGERVVPDGWIETMATPSLRNPNFGLGLWLGTPYVPMRTYFEGEPGVIPQSEPYLADDVRIMEGGGFRVLYMVPSEDLVIFRHGQLVSNWDGAYLVNSALRGLEAAKR